MNYVTVDEYYNTSQYNEMLQALVNNNVPFSEFIHIKPPFNWYIELFQEPIMVNFDKISKQELKYLVNKVEGATPNDDYLLQRRDSMNGVKAFKHYTINEPLAKANKSDYACFFNVKNKTQMEELSKELGELWYFGKYYNSIRVGLCLNKMIKNKIDPSDILVEKSKDVTQMELDLNFKVFRLKYKLRKFTETPSFKNGLYKPVKISRFNVNL